MCVVFLFFFKQKTAYEMRISDWSSDVCSSDEVKIYASYGTGYKAGGFDGSSIFSPVEALPLRPEKVKAYEAGLKVSTDGRFYASLDAFSYDLYELQPLPQLPPPAEIGRAACRESESHHVVITGVAD